MPIKTAPSRPIDFLSNYVPYTIGEEILVENINEMLTYSVQEYTQPLQVVYDFGSAQQLIKTILVKNTTSNANIELTFSYDVMYLKCVVTDTEFGEVLSISPETSLIIRPTRILAIQLLVSEKTIPVGGPFPTQFRIFAKNIVNNTLVTRRLEITPLQTRADTNLFVDLSI